MASRRYTSQFSYSFERMPVRLMAAIAQSGSVGAFATLVNNGITWTAVTMGAGGNSITVALVAGGTAGAEVVSVLGNAISVSVQSGVSTRTQVLTAVQASAAASALVGISVASGGTAATLLAATPLASGVSTSISSNSQSMSVAQIGTGVYRISIVDSYAALLGASIMLQRAAAVNLMGQIQAISIGNGSGAANYIDFRMQAGATPTNLASGDILYISLELRNSSQSQ